MDFKVLCFDQEFYDQAYFYGYGGRKLSGKSSVMMFQVLMCSGEDCASDEEIQFYLDNVQLMIMTNAE